MLDYIRSNIGFSWIGLAFLALLFVPNILWARTAPPEFEEMSAAEPSWLVVTERVGQALACAALLLTKSLSIGSSHAHSSVWWLVAAAALMTLYELFWIRYFAGSRTVESFYAPFLGIPVPGASLPVAALLCLSVYAKNPILAAGAVILGVGHIGIHTLHASSLGA